MQTYFKLRYWKGRAITTFADLIRHGFPPTQTDSEFGRKLFLAQLS